MGQFNYQSSNYNFPGNSGIFVSSLVGASWATEQNGVYLATGQTKERSYITDRTVVLFLGRQYPATEVGTYKFNAFDCTYSWPSSTWTAWHAANYSSGNPFGGTTGGSSAEVTIMNWLQDLMTGGKIRLQTPQLSDDYGGGGTYALTGTLTSDLKIGYLVDKPTWRTVSFSFCEVG